MRRELLIGCGGARDKRMWLKGREQWENLVTLDINPDHKPDVVWDLTEIPLPFADEEFDEIHAYEVLEHTGAQGDYKFFFRQWSDFWRVLKPGGYLFGTCPKVGTVWALGDPSHTRIVQAENFIFLDQTEYTKGVGATPMSDFRHLYKADFHLSVCDQSSEIMRFALQAVKPSRIDPKYG